MRIRRTATLALTATTAGLTSIIGVGASAAFAQTTDYPGGRSGQQVEASNADRADRTDVEGAVIGRSGEVSPAAEAQGAGLAVTGGDVAGLGALGAGLVAGGTVLVRRSRRRTTTA